MEDQGEDVERTVLPRHREVQYLDRRNTDVEDRGKKIQVAFHPVSVRDPKGDREVEELVKNDREVEHYQKEVKVPSVRSHWLTKKSRTWTGETLS